MQRRTDDEMVERYRSTRKPEFFEEIFPRHRGRIYTQCCIMLRDTARAEEIAQDVFVRAFRNVDKYEPGSLPAWLLQIAREAVHQRDPVARLGKRRTPKRLLRSCRLQ